MVDKGQAGGYNGWFILDHMVLPEQFLSFFKQSFFPLHKCFKKSIWHIENKLKKNIQSFVVKN